MGSILPGNKTTKKQLVTRDYLLETVALPPTQEFQKLAGKYETIPLLGGIKSVRATSEMKLLQSQVFV
jgi:hypothetical protein